MIILYFANILFLPLKYLNSLVLIPFYRIGLTNKKREVTIAKKPLRQTHGYDLFRKEELAGVFKVECKLISNQFWSSFTKCVPYLAGSKLNVVNGVSS